MANRLAAGGPNEKMQN